MFVNREVPSTSRLSLSVPEDQLDDWCNTTNNLPIGFMPFSHMGSSVTYLQGSLRSLSFLYLLGSATRRSAAGLSLNIKKSSECASST